MGKEVEMKDAPDTSPTTEKTSAAEKPVKDQPPTVSDQLYANVKLIEKAVKQKETRALFSKLLRQTQAVRKQLTAKYVQSFLRSIFPEGSSTASLLLEYTNQIDDVMMDTEHSTDEAKTPPPPPTSEPIPEIEIYAYLICIILLIDAKNWTAARTLATTAVDRLAVFNRRTLDTLAARIYFYLSLSTEHSGALAEIRSTLLALHRTAVLRHDEIGQETLLNLLLRNYISFNLYEEAEALRAKAQRDTYRSSHQHSRMLYYQGRIRAVQLEYSDAKDALTQAIRKAPPTAWGFKAEATKWLVVVRLLLGEIPERSELSTSQDLRGPLSAYLDIAGAVRSGDLTSFTAAAARHADEFAADGTKHLVNRLRANVLRAGLRRIATAYSRITLADVALKLGLSATEDAELVVVKAIRDGGVPARVDHDAGVMIAVATSDVYATDEPLAAFHARIAFCMDVHNEAQRAMRFDGPRQQDWDDANEVRERLDQELQAVLEDDDVDF